LENRLKYFLMLGWFIAIFLLGYVFSNNHEAEHNEAANEYYEAAPRTDFSFADENDSLITSGNSDAEVATFNDPSSSSLPFGDGYDRFHVGKFRGRPAPLRLSEDQKYYVTRMKDAYRQPVNFGGSLVLLQFGCGTGCTFAYALDKSSGFVLNFPIGGEEYQAMQLHAQDDSALVWASWYTDAGWEACLGQAWSLGAEGFNQESPVIKIDCASKESVASI
jgi:hypothetical protein